MSTAFIPRLSPLTAAILATLQTAALQVHAADSTPQQLPKISVGSSAEEEPTYKTEVLSSPKYTELARDTPQSVTVIPAQVMKDQNLLNAIRGDEVFK